MNAKCLLGGRVEVPSLTNSFNLFVSPGTSPSTVKVIKGKGPPRMQQQNAAGDLVVHFYLDVSIIFIIR